MSRIFSSVLVVSLGVAWAGLTPAAGQAQASAAQVAEGRRVFTTYCASCHGTDARGGGPVADALGMWPSDLTRLARTANGTFNTERVRRIIDGRDIDAHGSFEMPVWGDAFKRRDGLTEKAAQERIDAIVRFLASLQERAG